MVAVAKGSKNTKAKVVKTHPFFQKTPKNFRLGGSPPPKRDLGRFVRWPTCVQLQRKRAILLARLKKPAALKVFEQTLNRNEALQVYRLLSKYRPETAAQKKDRLMKEAENRVAEGSAPGKSKKPIVIKHGLNQVTEMIEQKKAKLVLIAHDVDPIELVVWLPTLCRKTETPYAIVKGKARLGQLVHRKTAAVVAVDAVRKEDQPALDQLVKNFLDAMPKRPQH